MTVTAQYAAQHFEELLAMVDGGESILITRPGANVLQLAPAPRLPGATRGVRDAQGRRVFGLGKGELRVPGDEEWAQMDRELEADMNHSPFMTNGDA